MCKVVFIGLMEVGVEVVVGCVCVFKFVIFEFGGKSVNIVFEDVDFECVVVGVFGLVFDNVG